MSWIFWSCNICRLILVSGICRPTCPVNSLLHMCCSGLFESNRLWLWAASSPLLWLRLSCWCFSVCVCGADAGCKHAMRSESECTCVTGLCLSHRKVQHHIAQRLKITAWCWLRLICSECIECKMCNSTTFDKMCNILISCSLLFMQCIIGMLCTIFRFSVYGISGWFTLHGLYPTIQCTQLDLPFPVRWNDCKSILFNIQSSWHVFTQHWMQKCEIFQKFILYPTMQCTWLYLPNAVWCMNQK